MEPSKSISEIRAEIRHDESATELIKRSHVLGGYIVKTAENITDRAILVTYIDRGKQVSALANITNDGRSRRIDIYDTDDPKQLLEELSDE